MSKAASTWPYSEGFRLSLAASLLFALSIDTAGAAVDHTGQPSPGDTAPLAKVTYERGDGVEFITLDLIEPIGHVAKRDGDQLIIWFDQPRRFDLDGLADRAGSKIKQARLPEAGATRWLVLDLVPGSKVDSNMLDDNRLKIAIGGKQGKAAVIIPKRRPEMVAKPPLRKKTPDQSQNLRAAANQDKNETVKPEPAGSEPTSIAIDGKKVKNDVRRNGSKSAVSTPRPLMPMARPTAAEPPKVQAATSTPAAPVDQPDEPPVQQASLPGQFEVDETALDRALERTLTSEGAVLMPFGMIELEPSLRYVRQELDTPSLINVFGFPGFGEAEVRRNDYTAALALRVGLPLDAQLEVDAPFTYVDQTERMSIGFNPVEVTDDDGAAFGDLGVGLAKTVLKEGAWWPDVVARVRWDSQTGKAIDNGIAFGGGSHELTSSVSFVKSQDPLAFFGSVAYEKTFEENDLDPGDRIGVSIGTVLAASPDTSLRASLRQDFIGDAEFEGDQLDGTDRMAATLNIGASSVLGRGILLDASAEVGLTEDAPDYAARLSLPIRFNLRRAFSLIQQPAATDGDGS